LFYLVDDSAKITAIYANAEAHNARVSGKLAVAQPTLEKRASFNGCSASQQNDLNAAASAAQNYAGDAASYLRSHTSATPRFTTWFGPFTSSRYNTVGSHFNNIAGNTFSAFAYDCTCTEAGTFAYVYPDQYVRFSCNGLKSLLTHTVGSDEFTSVEHSGMQI
jgi:peptidyl-Lys metalloendopeptidase